MGDTMSSEKKKVVLTGGGTVGHVMLNKLLIPEFQNQNIEPVYIGSKDGIETEIITATSIDYHKISSGKLRRYISFDNIKDMFKVLKGIFDARKVIKREHPLFIFSKGGFVSVPVVLAARSLKVPVYIHESDLTPGLANKIAAKFASKVFVTFNKTKDVLPADKTEYLGPVIRDELIGGDQNAGYEMTGFDRDRPVLLIMGGSLGSRTINEFVRTNLEELTDHMQIVHLCGRSNLDDSLNDRKDYVQYEFVSEELAHLMTISDVIVGRSGANAIFEFLLNKKPMILIPLTITQSRGDQLENAEYFREKGFAEVIQEEELNLETFNAKLRAVEKNRIDIVKRMNQYDGGFRPGALASKLINGGKGRE